MTEQPAGDPLGTAQLRAAVLASWTASPARFREDANAEEDYARGAYRDRLVVELAQNAADAAARAGEPGRLLLRLHPDESSSSGWTLTAANSGTALDEAGLLALSTLRASAKRDDPADTVGRYGVGFAAVLDVTDTPTVRSRTGGAAWSADRTREEVSAVPALAAELTARSGHVPVLRLPWPQAASPPTTYDTAVVLPLRDEQAVRRVRNALAEVDAALLLMLPALAEILVEDGTGSPARLLRAADLAIRTAHAAGPLDQALLADRPVEERRQRTWTVRWAYPIPAGARPVLHAPTPTDEPIDLPALLIASFPLEPGRRRVAPGPLRDAMVAHAAAAYADLVQAVAGDGAQRPTGGEQPEPGPPTEPRDPADGPEPWPAWATPGELLGMVPGPVAAGPLDADLRRAILDRLRTAPVLPGRLRPDEAVAVDDLPEGAALVIATVLPGLLPTAWASRREIDRLGVRRLRLADVVDDLASLDRPAHWWRALYEALGEVGPGQLEALTGLPVPLVDGRLVRGPRGTVVDAEAELAGALSALGLRVVDPAAGAELLGRLGAVPARADVLLHDPGVRAAVARSGEQDDPSELSGAVLTLVQMARPDPGDHPWLSALTLPDDAGEWAAAGELLLPDAALASVLEPGALGTVDPDWVTRWGREVLAAAGTMDSFAVVHDEDVVVDVDGCDHDLDAEDGWVRQVRDRLPHGDLPATVAHFAAVRDLDLVAAARWPQALRMLAGDPALRAAVLEPARVLAGDGSVHDTEPYTAWWLRNHPVLAGSRPDQMRSASAPMLAGILEQAPDVGVDEVFLRAIGVVTSVADVASAPMVLPLLRAGVHPSEGAQPRGPSARRPVPAQAATVIGVGPDTLPQTYFEHDELTVDGISVDWWVSETGQVHAATVDGLARALAWAGGRWDRRWLLAAVLAEPDRSQELLAEDAWPS